MVPVTNKVVQKLVDLPQWFGLIHGGRKIDKRLVFGAHLLPLLDLFLMWLNLVYEIVLSLRIKNDDSRNRNYCVMRKITIVVFYSIKNHNSCLCLILFSFRIDSVRYILCFESEDNNDDNENFKKIYEKNPSVGFDSIKITTLNLHISWCDISWS